MKRVIREAAVGLGLCALALSADAAGSADRGRELFESTQLGTSGTSCSSCHPGGRSSNGPAPATMTRSLPQL